MIVLISQTFFWNVTLLLVFGFYSVVILSCDPYIFSTNISYPVATQHAT